MKKIFLQIIILLIGIISFHSCETIQNINSRYKTASKEEQKENTPLEIDLATLDKNFLNKEDTNIVFYKIDADILKEVIRKSENKYTLCASFYYFCSGGRQIFDTIIQFANKNNINLVVLETTDWLYKKGAQHFFKEKKYYKPLLALDLSKYGYDFGNRRRWRKFLKELGIENYKDFNGNSNIILFDKDANAVFVSYFYEDKDKDKLKELINNAD